MDPVETLQSVADAVTDRPVEISYDVPPRSTRHAWLQKRFPRFFPVRKTVVIRPLTLGTLQKISRLLLTIEKDLFDKNNMLHSNYKAMAQHSEKLARIIAIAIANRQDDPPEILVQEIRDCFTPSDIMRVLLVVLKQMNIKDFMFSIVSVLGLNVLETSPTTQGSSIAPGTL